MAKMVKRKYKWLKFGEQWLKDRQFKLSEGTSSTGPPPLGLH